MRSNIRVVWYDIWIKHFDLQTESEIIKQIDLKYEEIKNKKALPNLLCKTNNDFWLTKKAIAK